ncbi:MAG TPA: zf-HC2 domain-containing protein [Candidatus Polarisedimenticolia bacterium]|nr:zf-HC2 domain-containing protein [Candidatus Polarisedimenticolia bacterium]
MSLPSQHPLPLLLYVLGELDAEEASLVEAHIRFCRECHAEADALKSTVQSARGEAGPVGKPMPARPPDEPDKGDRRGHAPASGRPARRVRALWIATAGIGAVLVAVPYVSGLLSPRDAGGPPASNRPAPGIRMVRPMTLSPPLRGADDDPALTGRGPFALTVVLPFDAAAGEYDLAIAPAGGRPFANLRVTVRPGDGPAVSVLIDSLPGPGRYELALTGRGTAQDDSPMIYPFSYDPDRAGPGSPP